MRVHVEPEAEGGAKIEDLDKDAYVLSHKGCASSVLRLKVLEGLRTPRPISDPLERSEKVSLLYGSFFELTRRTGRQVNHG